MTKEQLVQIITKHHTHVDILLGNGDMDIPVYTDVAVCRILGYVINSIINECFEDAFENKKALEILSKYYNNVVDTKQEMKNKFNPPGEGANV